MAKGWLSQELENELIDRIRKGDKQAEWQLWEEMADLTASSINRFSSTSGIPAEEFDYKSEDAFDNALKTFDGTKGRRFFSWYYWYLGSQFKLVVERYGAINRDYTHEDWDDLNPYYDELPMEPLEGRISAEGLHHSPTDEGLPDFGDEVTNSVARALVGYEERGKELAESLGISMSEYLKARKNIKEFYLNEDS